MIKDTQVSMSGSNLLSVDWDFFFPELSYDPELRSLYDWGHQDGGIFFLHDVWYDRAAGFILNNMPLPTTSGDEATFWSRFRFARGCKLYYAESHHKIYHPRVRRKAFERIVNYDAHHDGGYKMTTEMFLEDRMVTCQNWAIAFQLSGARIETVSPRWKKGAMDVEPTPAVPMHRHQDTGDSPSRPETFDKIFVCRSGGWTPPWLDNKFEVFIADAPVKDKFNLDGVRNRGWSPERLQDEVATTREMLAKWNEEIQAAEDDQ